jgi:hypothetical protein
VLSTELQIALAPGRTYRQLTSEGDAAEGDTAGARWTRVLGPVAFTALATGLMIAFAAVRWVSVEVVVTTTASYIFTVVLQFIAAALVILTARRRRVSVARAFELFFRGHGPWSLWMLAVGALGILGRGGFQIDGVALSAFVPVVWTTVVVAAFSRTVLNAGGAEAWTRALGHQVVMLAFALAYIAWAAGGWMRVVQAVTL